MIEWIGKLPTTNLRIVVSLVLAVATGIKVIGWNWDVPGDWLTFLTVWAGLDVIQFAQKRATHQPGGAA